MPRGKMRVRVKCPYCGLFTIFFLWSWAGHGKARCRHCGEWIPYREATTEVIR